MDAGEEGDGAGIGGVAKAFDAADDSVWQERGHRRGTEEGGQAVRGFGADFGWGFRGGLDAASLEPKGLFRVHSVFVVEARGAGQVLSQRGALGGTEELDGGIGVAGAREERVAHGCGLRCEAEGDLKAVGEERVEGDAGVSGDDPVGGYRVGMGAGCGVAHDERAGEVGVGAFAEQARVLEGLAV